MPQSVHERIEFEDNLIEEQQRKESQRQEVQDAINQFLAKGRQIEILPPQQVQTRSVVGGEQWSDYENIDDVLPFNSRWGIDLEISTNLAKFCATAQISCNSKIKCAKLFISLAPKKKFGADSNLK